MNKTQISTCNSGVQICRGSFNTFDTLSSCPFFWQVDGKNRQWRFNSCCNSRWWHTTAGDLPHTCQTWPISFSFSTSGFSINKFDCKIITSRLKITSSKFGFVFLLEFSPLEKLNPKQFEIIPIRLIPAFHSHICQGYCSFSSTF